MRTRALREQTACTVSIPRADDAHSLDGQVTSEALSPALNAELLCRFHRVGKFPGLTGGAIPQVGY